jgi:hypothetical protein
MAKDAKGHGSDSRGGTDQSKPIKDAGIIRAKGISAMYGPGSPGYPAHASGVADIGRAPLNRSAVLGAYNRNENNNYHSENIALLAKHFGTPEEHGMAREIISERNRIGHLPDSTKSVPNVRDWQHSISTNYYPRLIGNRK